MVARINPSKKEQLKIGSSGQIRRVNIGMLINFFEAYAFGHLRNFSKSEGTFDPTIFEMAQKKRVSYIFIRHELQIQNPLSRRELEVGTLVCRGFGISEIAFKLKISVTRVKSCLGIVQKKLGVETRQAMLMQLILSIPSIFHSVMSDFRGGGKYQPEATTQKDS